MACAGIRAARVPTPIRNGAHQDAVVGMQEMRLIDERSNDAATTLAVDGIIERMERARRRARRELPQAWNALERRGRKSWC